MIAANVARRYAKALVDLGLETGTLDALSDEISRAASAYGASADLRQAMENPLVSYAQKKGILTELAEKLGLGPVARNTLLLLNDRRRLRILPGVAQLLREISDAKKGVLRAEVISAAPLSEAYYGKLLVQLEKMTGKKVVLEKREDPALLAGVVTRIGDTVYDGSLLARLREMRHALYPN